MRRSGVAAPQHRKAAVDPFPERLDQNGLPAWGVAAIVLADGFNT